MLYLSETIATVYCLATLAMVSPNIAPGPPRHVLVRPFVCNDENFPITGFSLS